MLGVLQIRDEFRYQKYNFAAFTEKYIYFTY